jgi:lysophospholipase L1-like esterase
MNKKIQLLTTGIAIMMLLVGMSALIKAGENKSPIRIACVGDSITEGSGYTDDLRTLLGANYSVGNYGVSGSTVSLNSDEAYMNQIQFQKAKNFQPDIIIIMLGTNDASPDLEQYNETFEDDYSKLISSFQELNSNPQIWIVKSPPIQNNSLTLSAPFFSANVMPHIENVANDLNLPTIDVYSAFSDHSDYFMDGVHPDSDGAALIASTVYDAIT